MYKTLRSLFIVILVGSLISCGASRQSQKDMRYLQEQLDSLNKVDISEKVLKIQKGDLLSITFYSDDPETSAIYNQKQNGAEKSGSPSSQGAPTGGYLVDQNGNIHVHSLGEIKVEGLTKKELYDLLYSKLSPYLGNLYMDIRFMNFKITVLGEVNKPGLYSIPSERISILEVIGLAGDFTMYGEKNNVMIIREEGGKREFGTVDLRRTDVFLSPYYYLQQNDIIVVHPNPKKPGVDEQTTARNLTIATGIASMISVVAIIINVFK